MRRLLLGVALVGACDLPDAQGDGSSDDAGVPDCEHGPVVTYDTFGRGFLAAYCNGCHGSQVADRQGAPPATMLDDREVVASLGERILARTIPQDGAPPTMPPAGGITDEDRERLLVWLTCWPE